MKHYLLTEDELHELLHEALCSPAQTDIQEYLKQQLQLNDEDIDELLHEAHTYVEQSCDIAQYEVNVTRGTK